jgi:DNA gyrase/topoisomerase IV subunit A
MVSPRKRHSVRTVTFVFVVRARHRAVTRSAKMRLVNSDDDPHLDQRRYAMERLKILDAFALAFDRRDELMRVVGAAADADEARNQVMATFGLSEVQAAAVLDLQVRRFARWQRLQINAERDAMRAELGEV